jgi:heterodisulfide reductase subunit A
MFFDSIIIGAGVSGMESAINLGDMGYKVLIIEKDVSIGGKMIMLSKVFPTLDCASCISAPKMAITSYHPNITMKVKSEVKSINRLEDGTFKVVFVENATYVDNDKCTGCQECEYACSVMKDDEYNGNFVGRKAAFIAFPQAIPKKAVIEKNGMSPCIAECPGGIKAHGYISLIREGKYEKAAELVLRDSPLLGSLGKACYAFCETQCTRDLLEGSLKIRKLKEFLAEWYYKKYPEPKDNNEKPAIKIDKKIAVIGSGPAGISAAHNLIKSGYQVKIFEADSQPGGMLSQLLPEFRLPKSMVERDFKNLTALGVEIQTGTEVKDIISLKKEGWDAVFIGVGAGKAVKSRLEGENLANVFNAIDFLKQAKKNPENIDFSGKTISVIGGGNVAIDSARSALRLGAESVSIIYRRDKNQMPASQDEIKEAEEEGIRFRFLLNPLKYTGINGQLSEMELINMRLGEKDKSGRPRPVPVKGSESSERVDIIIEALGLTPQTLLFNSQLKIEKNQRIAVNAATLQTSIPGVFSGGDCQRGASSIIEAVMDGNRAAFYIDRFLNSQDLDEKAFDLIYKLPAVKKEDVLLRNRDTATLPLPSEKTTDPKERTKSFKDYSTVYSEDEARYHSSRCLDCGICSECGECILACPADAIDLRQQENVNTTVANSIILATGFNLVNPHRLDLYGYGKYSNVITAQDFERLLAPTKPYNSVLRPYDGKMPDNIAYVLCAGSRDQENVSCSQICCMYSIKQAQLIMGALPLADVTIYYIDIRAFGKGFEEFYNQAEGMAVVFKKGKIAGIKEVGNGDLIVRYEDIEGSGTVKEQKHDLVILANGVTAESGISSVFVSPPPINDEFGYIRTIDPLLNPAKTSVDGVFVSGTTSAPMDIPDSILSAGTAAIQAASYIEKVKGK